MAIKYTLERLEEVDRQIAEKYPMNHETIDGGIDALYKFFLTLMLKDEFKDALGDTKLHAGEIAKAINPAFMLRMLIACKRGLVRKEAAAAAQQVLENIGKPDGSGSA